MTETQVNFTRPEKETNAEGNSGGRGTWDNHCEFFLSCLGYAVGFGNIWRFPYLTYKNGGATFLIPYGVMLFTAGLPLFFLELSLGQYTSLGPNKIFLNLSPIFMGLGWAMLMISLLVSIYYNVILAWALHYTFASITSALPWGNCLNDFNSENCYTARDNAVCRNQSLMYFNRSCISVSSYCSLGGATYYNATHCTYSSNESTIVPASGIFNTISASEDYWKHRVLGLYEDITWDNMGSLNWELVGCLALAWLIVGACLIKGVKSSGKVVYFTAVFPYIVLVILFVRGVTLEGAYDGIEFYILRPNMSKLWEVEVWGDAATQIFYSLGSSFGVLITLASYNRFTNNCMRDAIIVSISNCSTSVFAGFVIFSVLGFMANTQGVSVEDLVTSGSGLAFVVYAEAVTNMPFPPIWSFLFFFMLITLGLDSQFSMVEALTTSVFDQWPVLREKKMMVVIIISLVMFLCGLTMVVHGGMYMFELFNFYSAGISVLITAIIEICLISYVYGFRRYMVHITDEMKINMNVVLRGYWAVTWCFLTPLSLVLILGISFAQWVPAYVGNYVFPNNIQALGWLITLVSVILIPVFAVYVIYTGKHKGLALFRATPKFCPAHARAKREANSKRDAVASKCYYNEGFEDAVATVYPRGEEIHPNNLSPM